MKDENHEENTGKDALNKAYQFLVGRNPARKQVCLFDCDTDRPSTEKNNVYIRTIELYSNTKGMKKGVENALVLDQIDIKPFLVTRKKIGDYGNVSTLEDLDKMRFCDYICSLNGELLKGVFSHLKTTIDSLIELFKD